MQRNIIISLDVLGRYASGTP